MDIFFGGVLIGLILGVWLSVAFFYFSLSRQQSRRQPVQPSDRQTLAREDEADTVWPVERSSARDAPPTFHLRLDTADTQEAFHHLVLMARGDRALAERLVHYEWVRTPQAAEIVLIHNAIDRWIQDNR